MSPDSKPDKSPPSVGPAPSSDEAPPASAPSRPQRRWRRRVVLVGLVLLVLLIAVVVSAPYLASTRAGSNLIASIASNQVQGALSLDELSLSWFGECGARGLAVADPAGREVLRVDAVTFPGGVWGTLTSTRALEKLSVEAPRAILYLTEDGQVSLAEAFAPREPTPPKQKTEPFSLPDAAVTIRHGVVKVVRPDGQEYEVPDIDVDVNLKAPGQVKATLHAELPDQGKLGAEIDLQGLTIPGKSQPLDASGNLRIYTDGPVDIGPVADFAAAGSGLVGTANVQVEATLQPGQVRADFSTELIGVASAGAGPTQVKPTDLRLAGQLNATNEGLSGEVKLDGEAATAQAQFDVPTGGQWESVSGGRLLSAVLAEEAIELPEFALDAKGSVDLPALARTVPAWLKIRPDTEITGGTLALDGLSVKGGSQPSANASLNLTQLTATAGGREVRWEPISVNLDVGAEPNQALQVRQAELKSSFGGLVAQGTATNLQGTMTGDLKKLHEQLNEIVELGLDELAGQVSAEIRVARAGDDRVDLSMDLTAENLRYKSGERELGLQRVALSHAGHVSLADQKAVRITTEKATVDLDGKVQATASGWYDLQQESFQATVSVPSADLAFLGEQAAGLGSDAIKPLTGGLALEAQVHKPSREASIESEGRIVARDVRLDGEVFTPEVSCQWADVRFAPETNRFSAGSAKLASDVAELNATNVDFRFGAETLLAGDVQGQADLEKCMALAARLAEMEEPPKITGRLALRTTCRADGAKTTIAGEAGVDNLGVEKSDGTVLREQVHLTYDAELANDDQKISLRELNVTSGPLAAKIAGTVEQYSTLRTLSLDGTYELNWDRLTELLHELIPSTAATVAVAGKTPGQLKVRGPANRPDMQPVFHDVSASADLGWTSAQLYGVDLGKLALTATLGKGQVTIPATRIDAAGGHVGLAGSLDFSPATPVLRTPPKLTVLEGIDVTPELGEHLLSRFNPIFGQATRMEGKVGLAVQNVALPLGEEMKRGGAGTGRLDLKNFKVQPGGLLATLLELMEGGGQEMYVVEVSGLNFVIKDGRIQYDDFTLAFAERQFDLKFYGSVGFDDTLDLTVSVPVRAELLKRLGVQGPVTDYARKLAGTRVDIPIVGTRQEPKLDLAKVDKDKLLKDVLKKGLLEDGGLLDKDAILGGEEKKDKSGKKKGGLEDLLPKKRDRSNQD